MNKMKRSQISEWHPFEFKWLEIVRHFSLFSIFYRTRRSARISDFVFINYWSGFKIGQEPKLLRGSRAEKIFKSCSLWIPIIILYLRTIFSDVLIKRVAPNDRIKRVAAAANKSAFMSQHTRKEIAEISFLAAARLFVRAFCDLTHVIINA